MNGVLRLLAVFDQLLVPGVVLSCDTVRRAGSAPRNGRRFLSLSRPLARARAFPPARPPSSLPHPRALRRSGRSCSSPTRFSNATPTFWKSRRQRPAESRYSGMPCVLAEVEARARGGEAGESGCAWVCKGGGKHMQAHSHTVTNARARVLSPVLPSLTVWRGRERDEAFQGLLRHVEGPVC